MIPTRALDFLDVCVMVKEKGFTIMHLRIAKILKKSLFQEYFMVYQDTLEALIVIVMLRTLL